MRSTLETKVDLDGAGSELCLGVSGSCALLGSKVEMCIESSCGSSWEDLDMLGKVSDVMQVPMLSVTSVTSKDER